jgi:hypothetical protein
MFYFTPAAFKKVWTSLSQCTTSPPMSQNNERPTVQHFRAWSSYQIYIKVLYRASIERNLNLMSISETKRQNMQNL